MVKQICNFNGGFKKTTADELLNMIVDIKLCFIVLVSFGIDPGCRSAIRDGVLCTNLFKSDRM